ncbi:MAG: fused MFS/spermidine synthase, partial [Bdellovibrionales bacterium]|nr:fused MFS/spermidine synthase [Bdellovibrionales bacterium]
MAETSDSMVATDAWTNLRRAALGITLFTGFTGLVYEVAWHRYLANILGSQARAAAIILAVFLGGLSVGYWIFGRISRDRSGSTLVSICGWIELGIGLWALLFPVLYSFTWHYVGVLTPGGGWSLLVDALLAIALIGVPTVLMGGTLPLLTQGLAADLADASPFHARVYAINTGGAFIGCLVAGFVLLPFFGLTTAVYSGAVINLLAGVLLLVIARRLPEERPALGLKKIDDDTAGRHISVRRGMVISLFAGFYSITLQVVLMRIVGLSLGSSEYAFSMIVAAFVLMLALGAWRIGGSRSFVVPVWINQAILTATALLLYLSIPFWPYYSHVIRILFSSVEPAFWPYYGIVFAVLCVVLAVPVGAMGSTMPLLFGAVKNRFAELGDIVGRLYAVNTLGCVLGALIGGYLLLYHYDLDEVFRICLLLMALTVILAAPWSQVGFSQRACSVLSTVLLGGAVFGLADWDHNVLSAGLFRQRTATETSLAGPQTAYSSRADRSTLVDYDDGPNTSVAIRDANLAQVLLDRLFPDGGAVARSIIVNGKSDGETSPTDMATMRLSGHLP